MAVTRLSAAVETDIVSIFAWTEDRFGLVARRRCQAVLATALRDIAPDPERPGSAARPELGLTIRRYHLRHSRERVSALEGTVRTP